MEASSNKVFLRIASMSEEKRALQEFRPTIRPQELIENKDVEF
jgi:hypothetical protein